MKLASTHLEALEGRPVAPCETSGGILTVSGMFVLGTTGCHIFPSIGAHIWESLCCRVWRIVCNVCSWCCNIFNTSWSVSTILELAVNCCTPAWIGIVGAANGNDRPEAVWVVVVVTLVEAGVDVCTISVAGDDWGSGSAWTSTVVTPWEMSWVSLFRNEFMFDAAKAIFIQRFPKVLDVLW